MSKFQLFFVLIVLSTFLACKTTKTVAELTDEDIEMSLSRGVCFGKCPVYNLNVYTNGFARLEKVRFMKSPGKYERMLTKEEYKSLKSAFKGSGFERFEEKYESLIQDLPMITVGYNNGKGMKMVKGKDERPSKLMELQYMLEKLVDNQEWKLVEAYNEEVDAEVREKEEDSFIYNEIIIEPNPGVRLPTWFKINESLGVRLLTRISEEKNLWLITYNTNEFQPEQIIKILNEDKDIKTAEFNKKLNLRRGSEDDK